MEQKPRLIFVDPSSSKVKQFNISFRKILAILSIAILSIVLTLKFSVDLVIRLNHNSAISRLQKKNNLLEQELAQMNEMINGIRGHLNKIEDMDDKIRTRIDIPPINEDVRKVGIGGSEISLASMVEVDDPNLKATVVDYKSILDRLQREVKLESESYLKLIATIDRKQDSLQYLPAIKPVANGRITDGFGMRRHPILKIYRHHDGVDFGAKRGTPILAPADGYVTFTGKNGGYGMFVSINHKYGFETRYGHMQKIYVRRGQFVKRGDKIGEVGNTGLSTNPHLHYEVLYHGKPVNPTDFYFSDIHY